MLLFLHHHHQPSTLPLNPQQMDGGASIHPSTHPSVCPSIFTLLARRRSRLCVQDVASALKPTDQTCEVNLEEFPPHGRFWRPQIVN